MFLGQIASLSLSVQVDSVGNKLVPDQRPGWPRLVRYAGHLDTDCNLQAVDSGGESYGGGAQNYFNSNLSPPHVYQRYQMK